MALRAACIQMTSGADMAANTAKIEALVTQAAAQGAQLVTLPENCFFMDAPGAKRELFTQHDHPAIKSASLIAKQHRIWLLVGSIAVKIDNFGKTVNRSLLLGDSGQMIKLYDKIHLFDVELPNGEKYAESARFLPGSKAVIANTPWGKLGMSVCYDVRFPHLYRALAQHGASIITVPSAFTQTTGEAHWHVLLRARAIENGCFIIAPAQTGIHPGDRKTFGHSLIVGPWGEIIADGGTEEGVIVADLDMEIVKEVRAALPSLQHDRPFELKA